MDVVIGSETFTIDFGEDGQLTVGELVDALSAYDQDTVIARQTDTADEAADEAADTPGKIEIIIGAEADTAEGEADTAEDGTDTAEDETDTAETAAGTAGAAEDAADTADSTVSTADTGDNVTITIDFGDDGELTIGELVESLSAYDQETVIAQQADAGGSFNILPPLVGFLAGVIVAAAVFVLLLSQRKKKKRRASGKAKGENAAAAAERKAGPITVEKLHEQGARPGQQDSFFVSAESAQDNLLAIVADGMGGLSDGDKVSQTAVSAAAQAFYSINDPDPQRLLVTLLQQANSAVNDLLGYNGLYQSGSTMVAGLIRSRTFYYISIGDSRIYLYRGGDLYQLNRAHVYRDDLYLKAVNGEGTISEADAHPRAAGLSSFLGMGELKYIDIPAQPVQIKPGDRFLLMTDGVYNALPDKEIINALEQPADTAAQLLNAAIQAKNYRNQDNYTCVILNC